MGKKIAHSALHASTLITPAMLVLFEICRIVGNETPNELESDAVGNDTAENSKSD